MSVAAPTKGEGVSVGESPARGRRRVAFAWLGSREGRIGFGLMCGISGVTLLGPVFAPHAVDAVVGTPYEQPSTSALLGTDFLGRDVLSRFLNGGFILMGVALSATVIAYLIGGFIGLMAGYCGGALDRATTMTVDVLLSIPAIVLALLLLAGLGSGVGIAATAIAFVLVPPIVRVVRSVTIEASANEYVEAAITRGEGALSIVLREILPNIRAPVLADFGVRVAWAVVIFAALSFLGLGQSPPTADWGLMISENRPGLLISPAPVIVPAIAIALLAISLNLLADSIARTVGGTVVGYGGR